MTAKESEFKGNPTIELRSGENDKWPFSFGVGKAKKILAHIPEITAFVAKYDKDKDAVTFDAPETKVEEEQIVF